MGEIREEVQSFYMRDYVEEKVMIMISHPLVLIISSVTEVMSMSVTEMFPRRWRQGSSSNSASRTWYKNLKLYSLSFQWCENFCWLRQELFKL